MIPDYEEGVIKLNSIQTKILSSLSAVFLIAIILIIIFIVIDLRTSILDENQKNVKVNLESLIVSLKNMMLTGNAPVLVDTMRDLSEEKLYKKFNILRMDGTLAFSDSNTVISVNGRSHRDFEISERLADDRTGNEKENDSRNIALVARTGEFIKKSFPALNENDYYLPIKFEDSCALCHDRGQGFRGVAHITLSTVEINNRIDLTRNILIVFFLITGTVMLIFIFLLIKRQIINRMLSISRTAASVSEGDFTKRISISGSDEIGKFADNLNNFVGDLSGDILEVKHASEKIYGLSYDSIELTEGKVMNNIGEIEKSINNIDTQTEKTTSGVNELTSTVEEITRNLENIMSSINRQTVAVEESSSSIEEIVRSIERTTGLSNQTHNISKELNKVAKDGGDAVKNAVESIREVSEYSKQIIKMLSLISNVTKNTNLLAMNAAIEAAHAGASGKGFAIVADEIRNLSEETGKNARDIGEVVNSIISRIDVSVNLAEKAGAGLETIMNYSSQSAQIIEQLNISMEEQNHGAKEILKAIQELVQVSEEVKLSIHEQNKATDEFADALKGICDLAFKNKDDVKMHINNLTSLISATEEIEKNIRVNQELASNLKSLMDKFKTGEIEGEKTNVRLVE